jgi:methionyl-tRNA synthetase
LINPHCKLDGATPVIRNSKHLFLNLTEQQPSLEVWFKNASEKGKWSSNSETITSNWLKEGLKPRCITRDLKWGTPVPRKGYEEKVFYVWFDAPIGYPSITANYTKDWEKWWKNPEQVQLYQFMGKDNVPFHTVIFPSTLLGTKENWTLLHHLSTTGMFLLIKRISSIRDWKV